MNLASRIVIGCANFNNDYNGCSVQPKVVREILEYAHTKGINIIETATTYGNLNLLRDCCDSLGLQMIAKGDTEEEKREFQGKFGSNLLCFLRHHDNIPYNARLFNGVSTYLRLDPSRLSFVEIPCNIIHTVLFQHYKYYISNLIIRSVFIKGQAFNKEIFGIPLYHLCWNFALSTGAKHIVIGVNNVSQLEDILSIPQYEIDYSKIGSGEQWIKSSV